MKRRHMAVVVLSAIAAGCGGEKITAPVLPLLPSASSALAVGNFFSCALNSDGQPYCWGKNERGQLGDSSLSALSLVPTTPRGAHTFIALESGDSTICGLDARGQVWCWGDDPSQPGIPTSYLLAPATVPFPRAFGSITVGRKFACGLDGDSNVYCWGENGKGQLGTGDTLRHATPSRVAGGVKFVSITAGFWSMCGLTAAGSAYCWGDNSFGELGTGDSVNASAPRAVVGGLRFSTLSGGSNHQCGIEVTSSTAYCWGSNVSGQLGDGSQTGRVAPGPVFGGLKFTAIRSHRANLIFETTCAKTSGGELYCWGWNNKGQVGTPTSETTDACTTFRPPNLPAFPEVTTLQCAYTPLKVAGVTGVTSADVGSEHACAIMAGGQMRCWGENSNGQLGDGTGVQQFTPVAPKGGLKFP